MKRGWQAWSNTFGTVFSSKFWVGTVLFGFLMIGSSPMILVIYLTGHIAEWLDNRKDGVQDVRE